MEWIRLKDRMPEKRYTRPGYPVVFILGCWDANNEKSDTTRAMVDERGEIIDLEISYAANLPHWTHWMDILDVPGGE